MVQNLGNINSLKSYKIDKKKLNKATISQTNLGTTNAKRLKKELRHKKKIKAK